MANSPAFGLSRKVSTVQQAIPVLGSRVLSSLVAGFALRSSISGPVRLDRFWDSSIRVAQLAARLTKEFRGVAADHAYTFGLFHDCGIAVLLQRFPDYRDTLQLANADGDRSFTEVEEARHATHHAAIGCFLTRSWGLAEDISRATLIHHDLSIFAPDAELLGREPEQLWLRTANGQRMAGCGADSDSPDVKRNARAEDSQNHDTLSSWLRSLPAGRWIRLAADLKPTERLNLQVLRTDTPLFTELVEARRNRRDDWYKVPAGHIDVCNVPIPTRPIKK